MRSVEIICSRILNAVKYQQSLLRRPVSFNLVPFYFGRTHATHIFFSIVEREV
jgi:hypothetical protein